MQQSGSGGSLLTSLGSKRTYLNSTFASQKRIYNTPKKDSSNDTNTSTFESDVRSNIEPKSNLNHSMNLSKNKLSI